MNTRSNTARQDKTGLSRLGSHGKNTPLRYLGLVLLCSSISALTLIGVYMATSGAGANTSQISSTLHAVFWVMVVLIAIGGLPFIMLSERNRVARQEIDQQTRLLLQEIGARQRSEAALQQAKEAADSKNVAKSKYVRGLSHELRTPLNAVLGYSLLLEDDAALPPSLKHNVRVIRRSGEHLSSLVDGLLDISMIEAGRLQIRKEEFRFADFLRQIVDMMSLQARDAGLKFVYETDDNLPEHVHTDEKKLRQILINLLSNAIRYTDEGTIALKVRYSGQVARFDVEDTGIGIASENLDRIFSPFERVEDKQRPASGGSGLGLTITQHLTVALGGEITVASEHGKGSIFSVKLFLPPVHAGRRQNAANDRPITGYDGARHRILVIDDDINQINFLKEALGKLGFDMLAETNGKTGLARAVEVKPDLVILDISMPDMTGWNVARNLREVTTHKIPVIILSASVPENSELSAAADIHDAYLMKPVRLNRLLECLQKLLAIHWTYAWAQPPQMIANDLGGEIPDMNTLSFLRHLGQIGHLQGIKTKLADMAEQDPQTALTANHLRAYAENCDLAGYRSAIESLMKQHV